MEEAAITMSERARLSVDVSELLRHPGTSQRLRSRYEMEGIAVALARVPVDTQVLVDVRLDGLVDGVHVAGRVSGVVAMECRRCVKIFNRDVGVEVDELFLPAAEAEEDEYTITDEEIDLETMVRDAMVLALPLNPVCREDCRGLCSTCGADLNEGDCGHSAQIVDIRWHALEKLRRDTTEG